MDEALFLCAGHSQPPLLSLWGFNMRQHKENDQKGNWSRQDSIVASYKYPAWKPRARAPEDARNEMCHYSCLSAYDLGLP